MLIIQIVVNYFLLLPHSKLQLPNPKRRSTPLLYVPSAWAPFPWKTSNLRQRKPAAGCLSRRFLWWTILPRAESKEQLISLDFPNRFGPKITTPALKGHLFCRKCRVMANHGSRGDSSLLHMFISVRTKSPCLQVPRSKRCESKLSCNIGENLQKIFLIFCNGHICIPEQVLRSPRRRIFFRRCPFRRRGW